MSNEVIELEGTIVGVGASLNNASGIGFEIEDSAGNVFTIAGLDRTDAKRVAPFMGCSVRLSVFAKDAD